MSDRRICRRALQSMVNRFPDCGWLVLILRRLVFDGDGVAVHAVGDLLMLPISLVPLPKLQQPVRLVLKQAALDSGSATQPP